MKKTIHTFLAILCFLLGIGIELQYHYCGDALRSVNWNVDSKPCNCPVKKQQDRSCCNTQTRHIQLSNAFAQPVAIEEKTILRQVQKLNSSFLESLITKQVGEKILFLHRIDWRLSAPTLPLHLIYCIWIV